MRGAREHRMQRFERVEDVRAVLDDVITELRDAYPARVIELEVRSEALEYAWGASVAHILWHVVQKALMLGRPDARVRVVVQQESHDLLVLVENATLHLPATVREVLLEALHRRAATAADIAALGFGLRVALGAARGRGGDIDLWSDETRGTTFTIRLPR